jgi:hypothetical protein
MMRLFGKLFRLSISWDPQARSNDDEDQLLLLTQSLKQQGKLRALIVVMRLEIAIYIVDWRFVMGGQQQLKIPAL